MNQNSNIYAPDADQARASTGGPPPQDQGTPTTYIPPLTPPQQAPDEQARYVPPQVPPQPQQQWGQQPQWNQPAPGPVNYASVVAPRPHRMPVVGPLLLILAGGVFLLNNLGYLDWGVWDYLWRLWPLLLIAIGVDLIVGRRSPVLSLVIVLVIVAAGVAFVAANGNIQPAGNLTSSPLSVSANGASSASVNIDFGVGELLVDSTETGQIATGSLGYYENWSPPTVQVNNSGGTANIQIKQQGRNGAGFDLPFLGPGKSLTWQIHLGQNVPTSLNVNTGTGQVTMDLSKLKLTDLKVDNGTGALSIVLPENVGSSNVDIKTGTGSIDLAIPRSTEARIKVSTGIGSVSVDSRFVKSGNTYTSPGYSEAKNKLDITLDQGIGSVNVSSR